MLKLEKKIFSKCVLGWVILTGTQTIPHNLMKFFPNPPKHFKQKTNKPYLFF